MFIKSRSSGQFLIVNGWKSVKNCVPSNRNAARWRNCCIGSLSFMWLPFRELIHSLTINTHHSLSFGLALCLCSLKVLVVLHQLWSVALGLTVSPSRIISNNKTNLCCIIWSTHIILHQSPWFVVVVVGHLSQCNCQGHECKSKLIINN